MVVVDWTVTQLEFAEVAVTAPLAVFPLIVIVPVVLYVIAPEMLAEGEIFALAVVTLQVVVPEL